MATKVSQWNSNIHILWERQITIVIYINDLFYSCSIKKFQFDIIDKCLSISRSILHNFFHHIYIFTTLFLFSFSGIHILQEFAQALVILEWHEIKIFNGINTILNTRNIYILVSFLLSRYKLIIRHEYDQAYSTMESKKWTYRYSYHNWQEKLRI